MQNDTDYSHADFGADTGAAETALPAHNLPSGHRRHRTIPNFGHALLFLVMAASALFGTETIFFAVVISARHLGRGTNANLLRDPRLLVPSMALGYLIAVVMAWIIFSGIWREPFATGIRWNAGPVRRRLYFFVAVGVLLSVGLQFISNYLPIPKTVPMDDFFRTRTDVWLMVIFGTFMAPAVEELAFRGFLFPSLASAWDWLFHRGRAHAEPEAPAPNPATTGIEYAAVAPPPSADPDWSFGGLVFSSLVTSVGFTMLHADQVAHAWAPLLVLYFVSIVLCLVRLRFHSLAASTVVHATYNATIFFLMYLGTDGFRHLDKMT
jgi:membrane protease YdiL (CAAX protease family)